MATLNGIPSYGTVGYRPDRPVNLPRPIWAGQIVIDLDPSDWRDISPVIAADALARMRGGE